MGPSVTLALYSLYNQGELWWRPSGCYNNDVPPSLLPLCMSAPLPHPTTLSPPFTYTPHHHVLTLSMPCRSLALTPLPGPLPPSWGDLTEPVEFDLSQNYLTGTLPSNWGKLTSLKIL